MKMLGARGREGIKRYRRRNERFLRNEIQYFQEISISGGHQPNQEAAPHTPESTVYKEETWEADKEMERFLTSLASLRVMDGTPGGTEDDPGKEAEEVRKHQRCL